MAVYQLISGAFEHSVLRVWEIYAVENVVLCIAVVWAVQNINFPQTQHGMFKAQVKSTVRYFKGCYSCSTSEVLFHLHELCLYQ